MQSPTFLHRIAKQCVTLSLVFLFSTPPSISASLATSEHTEPKRPPLYTYQLAPHTTICITAEEETYHAYLKERFSADNLLIRDLGTPRFSINVQPSQVLAHIHNLPSPHQKYYLHLLTAGDTTPDKILWIGKNLLAGGGTELPAEVLQELQKLSREKTQCSAAIDKMIAQKRAIEKSIEDFTFMLQQSPSKLNNPKRYEKATKETQSLEKKISQTEVSIKKCLQTINELKISVEGYRAANQSNSSARTTSRLVAKVNKAHAQQCKEDIKTLQQELTALQHQLVIYTDKKRECLDLLQCIHQLNKMTSQPSAGSPSNSWLLNSRLFRWGKSFFAYSSLSSCHKYIKALEKNNSTCTNTKKYLEIQEEIAAAWKVFYELRASALQKIHCKLRDHLDRLQKEGRRLHLASLSMQGDKSKNAHASPIAIAIEVNQRNILRVKSKIVDLRTLIKQTSYVPLTFDQQLIIATYIQGLAREAEELRQQIKQKEYHYSQLECLHNSLQGEKIIGNGKNRKKANLLPKERLSSVRTAIGYNIKRKNSYKSMKGALDALQAKLQASIQDHRYHLCTDTLLLLESNILTIQNSVTSCTIDINTVDNERAQLTSRITRLINVIEEKKAKAQSKQASGSFMLLNGALMLLTGGLASPLLMTSLVTPLISVNSLVGQVLVCSSYLDLISTIEQKGLKDTFLEALDSELTAHQDILPLLKVTCQRAYEACTIPTEALTFSNGKAFYVEAQAKQVKRTIRQIKADIAYLTQHAPAVNEHYKLKAGLIDILSSSILSDKHAAYLQELRRFNQCIGRCSYATQALYQACYPKNNFHLNARPLQSESNRSYTGNNLRSLKPAQASAYIDGITTRIDSLQAHLKSHQALLQKIRASKVLSAQEKENNIAAINEQKATIKQEQIELKSIKQVLASMTTSQTVLQQSDTVLHERAYNRLEIVQACQQLRKQTIQIKQRCMDLDQHLQVTEATLSDPRLKGSTQIIRLLGARRRDLISKQTHLRLTLHDLCAQYDKNCTTMQQREKIATLASLSITLGAQFIPIPGSSIIGVVASQAVQRMVRNGGDINGSADDICSYKFFTDVTTDAVVILVAPKVSKSLLARLSKVKKLKDIGLQSAKIINKGFGDRLLLTLSKQAVERTSTACVHKLTKFGLDVLGTLLDLPITQQESDHRQSIPTNTAKKAHQPQTKRKKLEELASNTFSAPTLLHDTKQVLLSSMSATAAQEIGLARVHGKLGKKGGATAFIAHKGLHAGLGAANAAASEYLSQSYSQQTVEPPYQANKGGHTHDISTKKELQAKKKKLNKRRSNTLWKSALTGATSACMAETVAELHHSYLTKKQPISTDAIAQQQRTTSGTIGKGASLATAYVLDQNLSAAYNAATNAIDNNFMVTHKADIISIDAIQEEIIEALRGKKGSEKEIALANYLLKKKLVKQSGKKGFLCYRTKKYYRKKETLVKDLLRKDKALHLLVNDIIPFEEKFNQAKDVGQPQDTLREIDAQMARLHKKASGTWMDMFTPPRGKEEANVEREELNAVLRSHHKRLVATHQLPTNSPYLGDDSATLSNLYFKYTDTIATYNSEEIGAQVNDYLHTLQGSKLQKNISELHKLELKQKIINQAEEEKIDAAACPISYHYEETLSIENNAAEVVKEAIKKQEEAISSDRLFQKGCELAANLDILYQQAKGCALYTPDNPSSQHRKYYSDRHKIETELNNLRIQLNRSLPPSLLEQGAHFLYGGGKVIGSLAKGTALLPIDALKLVGNTGKSIWYREDHTGITNAAKQTWQAGKKGWKQHKYDLAHPEEARKRADQKRLHEAKKKALNPKKYELQQCQQAGAITVHVSVTLEALHSLCKSLPAFASKLTKRGTLPLSTRKTLAKISKIESSAQREAALAKLLKTLPSDQTAKIFSELAEASELSVGLSKKPTHRLPSNTSKAGTTLLEETQIAKNKPVKTPKKCAAAQANNKSIKGPRIQKAKKGGRVIEEMEAAAKLKRAEEGVINAGVNIKNFDTFRGMCPSEVPKLIPSSWIKEPINKGVGWKYFKPGNKSDRIFIVEEGYANPIDLLHSGAYVKITKFGEEYRIPLKGNPAL